MTIPLGSTTEITSIDVAGGENLMRLAELYLDDATQWWRIWYLNFQDAQPPDFILSVALAQQLNGKLKIPPINPNATWP